MKLLLRITIIGIAGIQVILGLVFMFVPFQFAAVLNLPPAPVWTGWIFAMFGARALGYAYGMSLAATAPERHRPWLATMVAVQAVDWIGTLFYLFQGSVSLAQVSTAAFLPVVFIAVLSFHLAVSRQKGAA